MVVSLRGDYHQTEAPIGGVGTATVDRTSGVVRSTFGAFRITGSLNTPQVSFSQNALSRNSIGNRSVLSRTARSAVRCGSTVRTNQRAEAILPV